MEAFIFFLYLVCFSFIVTRISFLKKSGLTNYWLICLFLIKVIAGVAYGWFYSLPSNFQGSDTWRFFAASKTETDWLLKDPVAFAKDLFAYGYNSSGNLFIASNSYWNNLKDNLIIKLIAIINVATFKNYYADVIFFNFFFFFGPVALYRLLKEKIKANSLILAAFVFCIPSFLFWCSGLHKDGLIFMSVMLIAFCFNEWMKRNQFSFKRMFIIVVCAVLLFALRNFVLLLLIPALVTWYLCGRYPTKKVIVILSVYGICFAFFFISPFLNHQLDFPAYVVSKQNEFKALGGNSQLTLPSLQSNLVSFLKFLPAAIDMAFFRPHITEIKNALYVPAIAENIFLYFLMIYSCLMFFSKKQRVCFPDASKTFLIFCFVFAISNLILMGYTVTATGAIVRYRSFALPFIIAPLAAFMKLHGSMLKNRIIKN